MKNYKQLAIDEFWVHRDCLSKWLLDCGVNTYKIMKKELKK